MGRRKVEMKRIEDKASRQVTFSKRRSGLIKKANDLSLLCDVEVALIVFSNRGRLYEFCSGKSLTDVVGRYQTSSGIEETSPGLLKVEHPGISIQASAELVYTVQTCLDGPHSDDISVEQLTKLEKQLDGALAQARDEKYQLMIKSMISLQEQESILEQENEEMKKQIAEADAVAEKRSNDGGQAFNNHVGGNTSPAVNKETLTLLKD